MNWYKKAQLSNHPKNDVFPSDEDEAYFLGEDNYEDIKKVDPIDPYHLFVMELESEIASIEETIESYKAELQNPNLSTRSQKIDDYAYRKQIKQILRGQIQQLNRLKAQLRREQKKKEVFPEMVSRYQDRGPFRNPQ